MKILGRIFYTKMICLSLILAFSGCDLNEVYYREVVPSTYFTSKQSVLAFKNRPMTHFRWFLEHERWRLQEHSADVFVCPTRGPAGHWYDGGNFQRIHYHIWDATHPWLWEAWRGGTMGIALSLQTIEILEKDVNYESVGLTQADKDAHINELNVVIAYIYMRMLDFFGGMPIFTSTTQENVPRSTDKQTFDHIEKLLLEALPKLPRKTELGKSEQGEVSQGGAAMVLAQLYFNAAAYIGEDRFAQAADISQKIINGDYGAYDLEPTWWGVHSFATTARRRCSGARPLTTKGCNIAGSTMISTTIIRVSISTWLAQAVPEATTENVTLACVNRYGDLQFPLRAVCHGKAVYRRIYIGFS